MAIISINKGDYYYNYDSPRLAKSTFPTHFHQLYEIMYFISGTATFIVEGTEYSAGTGDIFITRPEELHSILLLGGKYTRHFFQFSSKFVSGLYGGCDLLTDQNTRKSGTCNKIPAALVEKYDLGSFFTKVQDELTTPRAESAVIVQSYTVQMLVHINKILRELQAAQESGVSSFVEQECCGETELKIRKIKDCIKRHVTENVSLDQISEEVFISKYYLCRFFKEHTGISPKQYVSVMRIHHARTLMAQGVPLSEVYEQCGFSDYSSFYRTFIKVSGITPGAFNTQMNKPVSV